MQTEREKEKERKTFTRIHPLCTRVCTQIESEREKKRERERERDSFRFSNLSPPGFLGRKNSQSFHSVIIQRGQPPQVLMNRKKKLEAGHTSGKVNFILVESWGKSDVTS